MSPPVDGKGFHDSAVTCHQWHNPSMNEFPLAVLQALLMLSIFHWPVVNEIKISEKDSLE